MANPSLGTKPMSNVHWYIVGGQHTYQSCVSIAAKEEPRSIRHKFYTEFDVVPVYSRDLDMLIKVSNALNIQVKDKVITKNFWSQLKNARAKWIEKGRHVQNWPVRSTIQNSR